jgi:hypothetical protein
MLDINHAIKININEIYGMERKNSMVSDKLEQKKELHNKSLKE